MLRHRQHPPSHVDSNEDVRSTVPLVMSVLPVLATGCTRARKIQCYNVVMIGLEVQLHLLHPRAFLHRTRTTYFSPVRSTELSRCFSICIVAKFSVNVFLMTTPAVYSSCKLTWRQVLDPARPAAAWSRRRALLLLWKMDNLTLSR